VSLPAAALADHGLDSAARGLGHLAIDRPRLAASSQCCLAAASADCHRAVQRQEILWQKGARWSQQMGSSEVWDRHLAWHEKRTEIPKE
jgi:hypothetical protein